MNGGNVGAADYALLSRLNALKKSNINLDPNNPVFATTSTVQQPVSPGPARELHSELLRRFEHLSGEKASVTRGPHQIQPQVDENFDGDEEEGRTVEDLLAELGPEDSWQVHNDERSRVNELLMIAQHALDESHKSGSLRERRGSEIASEPTKDDQVVGAVGEDLLSAQYQMEQRSEPYDKELDKEADRYLANVLDQLKSEAQDTFTSVSAATGQSPMSQPLDTRHIDLPPAPARDLDLPPTYKEATIDEELTSRLANLGMPSVPTTLTTASAARPTEKSSKAFTDEEIDSWCIICNDDATLSCKGCDGDLYCTNCWLEGHKGADAGYEERKHKAVQYVRGAGLKKQATRKHLIGA